MAEPTPVVLLPEAEVAARVEAAPDRGLVVRAFGHERARDSGGGTGGSRCGRRVCGAESVAVAAVGAQPGGFDCSGPAVGRAPARQPRRRPGCDRAQPGGRPCRTGVSCRDRRPEQRRPPARSRRLGRRPDCAGSVGGHRLPRRGARIPFLRAGLAAPEDGRRARRCASGLLGDLRRGVRCVRATSRSAAARGYRRGLDRTRRDGVRAACLVRLRSRVVPPARVLGLGARIPGRALDRRTRCRPRRRCVRPRRRLRSGSRARRARFRRLPEPTARRP